MKLFDELDWPQVSLDVWRDKFRYGDEKTPEETMERVHRAIMGDDPRVDLVCKLWFVPGGRIIAGAGTDRRVTLLNCLGLNTPIMTLEDGSRTLGSLVNGGVPKHVMTSSGWELATFRSFGVQPTQLVVLAPVHEARGHYYKYGRSEYTQKIEATPDHRWLLANGEWTTKLAIGDVVSHNKLQLPEDDDYKDGFRHGLIFGDGHLTYTTKRSVGVHKIGTNHYSLRLCGEKAKWVCLFEHVTYSPSNAPDPTVYLHTETNAKAVPERGLSASYYSGFIAGWTATDGAYSAVGSPVMFSQDEDALDWLFEWAPVAGYIPFPPRLYGGSETNYGERASPLYAITLSETVSGWRVVDLIPLGEEEVGCAIVPKATAFTLTGGVYTGNCYVMDTIGDSLVDILRVLTESAITMQYGGGIGMDFSTLRPKGFPISTNPGAFASGPLSYMDMWDSMCRTIMSAGNRRGAMMAVMRINHPDIEEFIEAKQTKGRLNHFNVSVLVSDHFMTQLRANGEIDLVFEGVVTKRVKAAELWDKVMRATYNSSDPGVIFIDRVNEMNPLKDVELIAATNPCVTGDTLVLTDNGYNPIIDLVDKPTMVWNGYEWSSVTPRKTGDNEKLVNVLLSDGSELRCTPYHTFILSNDVRTKAKNLQPGDKLAKHTFPVIEGFETPAPKKAYTQGFFSGDGWQSGNKQYIGLYGDKKELVSELLPALSNNEYKVNGGYPGTDTSETKLYLYYGIKNLFGKEFVPSVNWTVESRLEWLAGLSDSDGYLTSDGSIQISSKDRNFLLHVKWMLNTLGATGVVSAMKDCHRLGISASNVWKLLNLGFRTYRLTDYKKPNREASRFITVVDVINDGEYEDVYCFTEPKNHSAIFDGVLTGQCGEQPLPPYGACNLGAINLPAMLDIKDNRFEFNFKRLEATVKYGVEFLNNVIEKTIYPLPQQEEEMKKKRRIGLGIMGLGTMLNVMKLSYGKIKSIDFVNSIMDDIRKTALAASKNNGTLLTVAPTGDTGIFAKNVSGGLEPVFALEYTRSILQPDGTKKQYNVKDASLEMITKENIEDDVISREFLEQNTALRIAPRYHLEMQAAIQHYVDASVSKTINLPEKIPFKDMVRVYESAYDKGCKGCTTYRPNSELKESVLSLPAVVEEKKERPSVLKGQTYKLKFHGVSYYLTINEGEDGKPFEIFVNTKNKENQPWVAALTRMVSAIFRKGGDTAFVAKELQQTFSAEQGDWVEGRYYSSIVNLIGATIERHQFGTTRINIPGARTCPSCGETAVVEEAGCLVCKSCGSSKC